MLQQDTRRWTPLLCYRPLCCVTKKVVGKHLPAAIMVECRGMVEVDGCVMGDAQAAAGRPPASLSRRREWREAHGQRQTEDIIFYLRFYSTLFFFILHTKRPVFCAIGPLSRSSMFVVLSFSFLSLLFIHKPQPWRPLYLFHRPLSGRPADLQPCSLPAP